MRVLIALILFIFTLSAAYTLDTAEKPTEKLHPAMGSVLQVEKHKPQFISPALHPDCMLPADHVYEIHTFSSSPVNGTYNIYSSLSVQTCHAFSKPSDFLYKTGPRFRPGNINRDTRSHRKAENSLHVHHSAYCNLAVSSSHLTHIRQALIVFLPDTCSCLPGMKDDKNSIYKFYN